MASYAGLDWIIEQNNKVCHIGGGREGSQRGEVGSDWEGRMLRIFVICMNK